MPRYTVRMTCRSAASRVARHLTAVHAASAALPSIASNLVITNSRPELAAAAVAEVDLLILDGHGRDDTRTGPRIGTLPIAQLRGPTGGIRAAGIVLGCCSGATAPFIEALRTALDRTTAVLACAATAHYEDGEVLFTAILNVLESTAPAAATADSFEAVMRQAHAVVVADHPHRDWTSWLVDVIHPTTA